MPAHSPKKSQFWLLICSKIWRLQVLSDRQQGEDASQEQSSDSDTHNEFLWKLFDDQMGRGDIQKDDQWRKHQYAKPPLEKAADVISHICQNKSIHAALICESLSIQLSAERLW